MDSVNGNEDPDEIARICKLVSAFVVNTPIKGQFHELNMACKGYISYRLPYLDKALVAPPLSPSSLRLSARICSIKHGS